jgi:formylmethanofuran dehydrogenase subunit B
MDEIPIRLRTVMQSNLPADHEILQSLAEEFDAVNVV